MHITMKEDVELFILGSETTVNFIPLQNFQSANKIQRQTNRPTKAERHTDITSWNFLPVQLRDPDIIYGLFRRQLKGHLFQDAWTWRSVTSVLICGALEIHLLTYLHAVREKAQENANILHDW